MSTTEGNESIEMVRAIGHKWWLILIFGVITLGFGIVLTFKPGKSVHTIAIIIAIWLLFFGVIRLIQSIGTPGARMGLFIVGLLSILIAIILLHHTTTSVAVVGFVIGIFWTVGGAAQLTHGFSANDGKISWLGVVLGIIALVIGILCLVYPSLSLSIICVINGLGLIVYGLVEILASFQIRKLKDA